MLAERIDRDPIHAVVAKRVRRETDGVGYSDSAEGHDAVNATIDLQLRHRMIGVSGVRPDEMRQFDPFGLQRVAMTSAACFWRSLSPL